MKIILFNGPPRAGKDTAMLAVREFLSGFLPIGTRGSPGFQTDILRFSAPIKEAFAAIMETELEEETGQLTEYEQRKEEVIPLLGASCRQWQIDFSEKFMKPQYGNDVFARIFTSRVKEMTDDDEGEWVVLVPDCGFQVEIETVLASFNPEDVLLMRIFRKDYGFAGDSREYVLPFAAGYKVSVDKPRCCYTPIVNVGSREEFGRSVVAAVRPFLLREAFFALGRNQE